jgi:hypothetical protein
LPSEKILHPSIQFRIHGLIRVSFFVRGKKVFTSARQTSPVFTEFIIFGEKSSLKIIGYRNAYATKTAHTDAINAIRTLPGSHIYRLFLALPAGGKNRKNDPLDGHFLQ